MKEVKTVNNRLQIAFEEQINPDMFSQFLNSFSIQGNSTKPNYLAVSLSIDSVDPLAVVEQDPNKESFQYYWEKPSDSIAMVASGELERIITSGANRYREASQKGKEVLNRVHHISGINHPNAVVHLFGGFSFFDESPANDWNAYKAGSFTLPEWMIIKEGKATILTLLIEMDENFIEEEILARIYTKLDTLAIICDRSQYNQPSNPEKKLKIEIPVADSAEHEQWIYSIDKAKNFIKSGEFEKVVLARKVSIQLPEQITDTCILNRLRKQYNDCYSFLIRQNGESSFIGSTPERLASFRSNFVLTEGLAGSTSRGKTATEDALLEFALLNNAKELKEHEIVLEAINETLTDYADKVSHPKSPQIKKLSNVQHLYTPITAEIRKGVSRTEVLKTLHPTPAVGGFPRNKAVEFIRDEEDFDRGWYASPIGWINAHGNGEFVVAIRSGLIQKDKVQFFAGCGIVEDSDPEKEWEETNLKFIPMLSALEYAGS